MVITIFKVHSLKSASFKDKKMSLVNSNFDLVILIELHCKHSSYITIELEMMKSIGCIINHVTP